jgi:RNA polymerase sigma-70 factor (ECF subfamily)
LAELQTDEAMIAASKGGDEEAFQSLVQPLSRELQLLCYRMLGSFHDAEDAVQETLLKAWRRLDSFDNRSSFRTWMHRIATNTCLDLLRTRQRRVLPMDLAAPIVASRTDPSEWGAPALDVPWLEPFPDSHLPEASPEAVVERRESISLAFVRALQLLPARQRAVLILRDVLDWSAEEAATTLETSVPAVNSALQRARATTSREHIRGDVTLSEARLDDAKARIAASFVRVWEDGDVPGLLSLLTEDAIATMPPMLAWFQGIDALRDAFAIAWDRDPRPGVFRAFPTSLNGQLAFAFYYRPSGSGPYEALDLTVIELTSDGSRIREMMSFVRPDLFAACGFPPTLDEAAS